MCRKSLSVLTESEMEDTLIVAFDEHPGALQPNIYCTETEQKGEHLEKSEQNNSST